MDPSSRLVLFTLDKQFYALRLEVVERVVRAMEITPLPNAPTAVFGIINVQGRIIPVVNLRQRFGLPAREIQLSDQFIIARTPTRVVALVVDTVTDVSLIVEQDIVAAQEVMPNLPYLQGVGKISDSLILIHDLDRLLSLNEEKTLDHALEMQGTSESPARAKNF